MKQDQVFNYFKYGLGNARGSSVECDEERLYFDGRTLAIKQDFGNGIFFLVNGDRNFRSPGWGNSSPQWGAIRKLKPNVQIPFSALEAARVNTSRRNLTTISCINDLKILDVREDKSWNECPICGKKVVHSPYRKQLNGPLYYHIFPYSVSSEETPNLDDPICKNEKWDEYSNPKHCHQLGAVLFRVKNRYFLSSIDDQERNQNYFLCELNECVTTIEEAFDSLRPQEVKIAKPENVIRQGEVFLVKTDKIFPKDQIKKSPNNRVKILGVRHYATEVVEIKNKKGNVIETYCRGTLKHETTGRKASWGRGGPEHKRVTMGKVWHKAFQNTVKGSWQASGKVD